MNTYERLLSRQPLFGTWFLDGLIGEGSYGQVYRLKREEFGQAYHAALKVITIPQSEAELHQAYSEGMDAASVQQYFYAMVSELLREIRLMNQLKGTSNIVSYEDHQIVEWEKGHYDILIRMELLRSLTTAMQESMSPRTVIKLGIDICKALELCQKYSIIHRDIKPDNIFISQNGDFKLGDFGIARQLTHTLSNMSRKGTYAYMAPEVYKGGKYGSNVDIYSLSLVLYRLLNHNRAPFLPPYPQPIAPNSREQALMQRLGGAALPPPDAAVGRLADIVCKGASHNPKDRYETPQQLRAELEALYFAVPEAPDPRNETPHRMPASNVSRPGLGGMRNKPHKGAPSLSARSKKDFLYQPASPGDLPPAVTPLPSLTEETSPSIDDTVSLSRSDTPKHSSKRRKSRRAMGYAVAAALIGLVAMAWFLRDGLTPAEKDALTATSSAPQTPRANTVSPRHSPGAVTETDVPILAMPTETPTLAPTPTPGLVVDLSAQVVSGPSGRVLLQWKQADNNFRLMRITTRADGVEFSQPLPIDPTIARYYDVVAPGYRYEYRIEAPESDRALTANTAAITLPAAGTAPFAANGFQKDDFFLYLYRDTNQHDRIQELRKTDFSVEDAIGFCLDFRVDPTAAVKNWLVCWEVSSNDLLYFDNDGAQALAVPAKIDAGFLYFPIANSGATRWQPGTYTIRVFIDGQIAAQGGFIVR